MGQSGGATAKLLGLLLVVALLASAALYAYGANQQPLALGALTAGAKNLGRDTTAVTLDRDGALRFAAIVRNAGRLPITLEGVATPTGKPQPLIVASIGLGDGADPAAAAVFTPVALDPGTGIGIVIEFAMNPFYPCDRLGNDPSQALPLPPMPLRFSSYGITGTQMLESADAPVVVGLTRKVCATAA
jgi:hypothetical protein